MFLNPLLLWGLGLASVPVIIHLLRKRRVRVAPWAAMDFLYDALRQNRRRLQLRDVVLMLIRTAAVVCLALALARPTLARRTSLLGAQATTAAVLLVDNSYSMGYHNGRETALDVARRLCKTLLAHWDKNTWCALLTFSHDVRAPLGDPSQNLAFVEQELDRAMVLTDGHTDLEQGLRRSWQLFQTRPDFRAAHKELYILSDLQACAWDPRRVSPSFAALLEQLSRSAHIFLIDAGEGGGPNAALTELAVSDPLATADMPLELTATVRNFGRAPLSGLPVEFHVDAAAQDAAPAQRTTVDVAPGQSATVRFGTRFATGGDHRIEARLGPDRLSPDNRRFLTVEVIGETHFLLVDGSEEPRDDPLSSEAGYLRYALSPRDPDNPERRPVVVAETAPHYRLAEKDLAGYQALALCNVGRIPEPVVGGLARQVAAGMGLLIFLGDRSDPAAYEGLLGERGAKLLPALIGEPWGEAPRLEDPRAPAWRTFAREPARLAHPVMAAFTEEDATDLLARVKVYRAYALEPLPGHEVQVAAYFEDGSPALVERRVGAGRVFLCPFPATTAWSNLPTQYAFPILMQRVAARLTLGPQPAKNLPAGDSIRGFLGVGLAGTRVYVTPPGPAARREADTELAPDGRSAFELAGTDRAGFYEVAADVPGFTPLVYSVSPDAETEGDLTPAAPGQLRKDYPGFQFTYVSKSEDLAARLRGERRGVEVWPWLLCLVFALLLLESVLALRWAPKH
jgi:hypothetical protein